MGGSGGSGEHHCPLQAIALSFVFAMRNEKINSFGLVSINPLEFCRRDASVVDVFLPRNSFFFFAFFQVGKDFFLLKEKKNKRTFYYLLRFVQRQNKFWAHKPLLPPSLVNFTCGEGPSTHTHTHTHARTHTTNQRERERERRCA